MVFYGAFLILLCLLSPLELNAEMRVASCIIPHSPSINGARDLTRWNPYLFDKDTSSFPAFRFETTFQVDRTSRSTRIAQTLFGNDCLDTKYTFRVAGSRTSRNSADWLADNQGLPTDYESFIFTTPRVNSFFLFSSATMECNAILPHTYVRIDLPIMHTRWDLNIVEQIENKGTQGYDAGYFTPTAVERPALSSSFAAFISGNTAPQLETVTFNPLKFDKISLCALHATHIPEIVLTLGWRAAIAPTHELSLFIISALACGNKPEGIYLFEPIVGNGHQNQLGVGLEGYFVMFENPDAPEKGILAVDGIISHPFSTHQHRTFDLKGKPLSRYMLAARYETEHNQNLAINGGSTLIPFHFAGEFTPIANLTHHAIQVKVPYEAEANILFSYQKEDWWWSIGYGIFSRASEQLCITQPNELLHEYTWGIKGDAQLFGFEDPSQTPVALSATQSNATIYFGQNFGAVGATTPAAVASGQQNPRIDSPQAAFADAQNDSIFEPLVTLPAGINPINTSASPVFITAADIDRESAANTLFSQRIVGQIRYVSDLRHRHTASWAFGAFVEFGKRDQFPTVHDEKALNTSMTVWSIWFNAAIAFD